MLFLDVWVDNCDDKLKLNTYQKPYGKSNQESDVAKHLILSPNRSIDFNSPEIIGRSSSNRKLRIKETLLI